MTPADRRARIVTARGPVVLGIEGSHSRLRTPRACASARGRRHSVRAQLRIGAQLQALTASIRALRAPALLICVDHEGGRVQRFREGFTPSRRCARWASGGIATSPPPRRGGRRLGRLIATELRAHGVDFSFTPVLDLDFGASTVIGDRAFHANPNAAAHLASRLRRGLNAAAAPRSASISRDTDSSRRIRTSTCRWTSARWTRCSRTTSSRSRCWRTRDSKRSCRRT